MKKIRCVRNESDFLKLFPSTLNSKEWFIVMFANSGEICLDAHAIRKLRKQLKRVLIEIEGEDGQGDQEKEESEYIPHVGEVVEVFQNTVDHNFKIGQKVRVVEVEGDSVKAESLDGIESWWVSGDIRPIQNWKPKEGEKVLIVDSTYVPNAESNGMVGKFGEVSWCGVEIAEVYTDDGLEDFHISDLRPAE